MTIVPCTASDLLAQGTFQSISSGPWSSASTWQLVGGSDSDGIPDTNDVVTVMSGHTVTVAAASQGCSRLLIAAGGTLQLSGAGNVQVTAPGSVTVNGTATLGSTGTIVKFGTGPDTLFAGSAGKITVSGPATPPGMDVYRLDPASTVEYTYAGAQNVRCDFTYGNLTLAGTGNKTAAPFPPDTAFHCDGTLTVSGGVNFDVSTNILNIYLNGNLVNTGVIDASVGITILFMKGSTWTNNGSYLGSTDTSWDALGLKANASFTNTTLAGTPAAQTFQFFTVNGSVTAQSGLTIKKNLIIAAGATFNAGSGLTHAIQGNIINNGTLNAGTSTITLNGTPNQWVGGGTFYNLTLNDTAGATLSGAVTVASGGTLLFSHGNLALGAYNLTLLGSVSGAGPTRAIVTAGTGNIVQSIAGGNSAQFPLSTNGTDYNPVGISLKPGDPAETFSVRIAQGVNPAAPNNQCAVQRTWTIVESTPGGNNANLTFQWDGAQEGSSFNRSSAGAWQYNGTSWIEVGTNAVSGSGPYTLTLSGYGVGGFGPFIVGNDGALPVTLSAFTAEQQEAGGVALHWTTISEVNSYGFEVERGTSADGPFNAISPLIPGNGTSNIPRHYMYTDDKPPTGTLYYRLRQIDLDWSFRYSEPIRVEGSDEPCSVGERFALCQNYPNPFNPSTEIRFSVDATGPTTLILYNAIGQAIATLFDGVASAGPEYVARLDGTHMASGVYFYRLTSGQRTDLRKMILLK